MAISKKLEIIYHNGQPDGIRSIRRHLSTMTTYAQRMGEIHQELLKLQAESNELMDTISKNMKEMGL